MAERGPVSQEIANLAETRIEKYLREKIQHGERVVSLSELSEATAIDPNTAEAVMEGFSQQDGHPCRRFSNADTRWYLRRED